MLGLTLSEAVDRMRGLVGTDIVLMIRREGVEQPFETRITRAIIKIQSIKARIEENAAYIRITKFNEQAEVGLIRELGKIKEELGDALTGVILDLRNNPGGLLDLAIAISDAFLDKGEIVSTRGRRTDSVQRFNAKAGDLADSLPIVVLIVSRDMALEIERRPTMSYINDRLEGNSSTYSHPRANEAKSKCHG